MPTGTVKWFSDEKGFGFITPEDGGKDLFVHFSGIAGNGFRTLPEGARFSYDPRRGPQGPDGQERHAALCGPLRPRRPLARPAVGAQRAFAPSMMRSRARS